jgi:hypothetical protein
MDGQAAKLHQVFEHLVEVREVRGGGNLEEPANRRSGENGIRPVRACKHLHTYHVQSRNRVIIGSISNTNWPKVAISIFPSWDETWRWRAFGHPFPDLGGVHGHRCW